MLPDQDCCQLFLPRRVATHAAVDQLLPVEARAGVDTLVGNLLDRMQRFDFGPEAAGVELAATASRVG
ncbi:hypothetical protein MAHJHV29_24160 [Mycobacterium avium subsp. hominissuis]